jgi:hypothetical protein
MEIGHLGRGPFLNALIQLVVAVEILTGKKSLQFGEQMKICKLDNPLIPIRMKQVAGATNRGLRRGVVGLKHNSRTKHAAPFFLYRAPQLIQGFTTRCCTHCRTSWEEIKQQNSLPAPEHDPHSFSGLHRPLGRRVL